MNKKTTKIELYLHTIAYTIHTNIYVYDNDIRYVLKQIKTIFKYIFIYKIFLTNNWVPNWITLCCTLASSESLFIIMSLLNLNSMIYRCI